MQIINFQDKLKNRNQRPILPKLTKATIIRQARINKLNQIIKPRIAVQPKQPTRKDIEVQTSFTKNDINNLEQENEIPDMSKDEDWEDFRLCMQQSCSGGDDQPNNVQCYKSLNFDNVFLLIYISPRTSISIGSFIFSGIVFIVLAL